MRSLKKRAYSCTSLALCVIMLVSLFGAALPAAAVPVTADRETPAVVMKGNYSAGVNNKWVALGDVAFENAKEENASLSTIAINPEVTYQKYWGMGTSLDETSIANIWKLSPEKREAMIKELADPETGGGFNLFRITIGSPDCIEHFPFWSYDELPEGVTEDFDLEYFSIEKDEYYHIIDVIKLIQKYNPDAKFYGSAWSAPAWMTTSNTFRGYVLPIEGTSSFYQASKLRDDCLNVLARYYVKTIQAFAAHGIKLSAITMLNEPGMDVVYPAMDISIEQQKLLAVEIKNEFAKAGLDTELWGHDFNVYDWKDPASTATKNYYRVFEDEAAYEAIDAIAFHPYWGGADYAKAAYLEYDKPIHMTETGTMTASDAMSWYQNMSSTYTAWTPFTDQVGGTLFWTDQRVNMTDEAMSQLTPRWRNRVAVITANVEDPYYTYNGRFYELSMFSKYTKFGATRIDSNNGTGLNTVTFRNPDGEIILIVRNTSGSQTRTGKVTVPFLPGKEAVITLPGGAVAAYRFYEPKVEPVTVKGNYSSGTNNKWVALNDVTFNDADAANNGLRTITIDASEQYQKYWGMGTSLDETSIANIWKLPEEAREAMIKELADSETGGGFDLFRITIGSPDCIEHFPFWSYDELPEGVTEDFDLEYFSIEKDEYYHIIDVIKLIQKYNPDAKFYGSAWSAPAWMTTSNTFRGYVLPIEGTTNFYQASKLRDDCINVFARYYVKTIQAFAAHGIKLSAITMLNEPGMDVVYPAMDISIEQQKLLAVEIKKEFAKAGLDTELWAHDFNFWDWKDPASTETKNYYRIFEDAETVEAVDGIAFHPYWGPATVMSDAYKEYGKSVHMTETGTMTVADAMTMYKNMASTYTAWTPFTDHLGGTLFWTDQRVNMTDEAMSRLTPRWRNRMGVINTSGEVAYNTFQSRFYGLSMFSKYTDFGATRIDSSDASGVTTVTFRNPDGEVIVVANNTSSTRRDVKITMLGMTGKEAIVSLPGSSTAAYRFYPDLPSAQDNQAPVLEDIDNIIVDQFDTVSLQLAATDADGDAITFYGKNLPAGMTVSATGLVSYAPTTAGSFTATFVASDGSANDKKTVGITVNAKALPIDKYVIEAENYYQQSGWTVGGDFIEYSSARSGGANVGYTAEGNWLKYFIDVPTAGTYTVTFSVANGNTAASPNCISLRNEADKTLCTVSVPATGGWSNYINVEAEFKLPAGEQYITLFCNTGGFNVDFLRFTYKEVDPLARFLKTDGKYIKNSNGTGEVVTLVGTNAGGLWVIEPWMCAVSNNGPNDHLKIRNTLDQRFAEQGGANAMLKAYRASYWQERDFDNIKEMGFNHIRLPLVYLEMLDAQGNLRADFLEELDWFVAECAEREIYVVLDLHGAPGSQNGKDHSGDTSGMKLYTDETYMAATEKLWVDLATHFAGNPTIAAYDLLNEPEGYGANTWGEVELNYFDRLYKAIRAVDPDHIIMFEAIWEPTNMPYPSAYGWENVVYSYHFYGWENSSNNNNGQIVQRRFTNTKFAMVDAMNFDVPVYVGEFTLFARTGSWEYALANYENYGWSWASWTYKTQNQGSWGLYNSTGSSAPKVNVNTASYETIMNSWTNLGTGDTFFANNSMINVQSKYAKRATDPEYVEPVPEPEPWVDNVRAHVYTPGVTEATLTAGTNATAELVTEALISATPVLKLVTSGTGVSPTASSRNVAIKLGEVASVNATGLPYLKINTYDTQGSNTLYVTLIDKNGATWSAWSNDTYRSEQNKWAKMSLNISAATIDKSAITEVRLGMWNPGTYYFGDVHFSLTADDLAPGTPQPEPEPVEPEQPKVIPLVKFDLEAGVYDDPISVTLSPDAEYDDWYNTYYSIFYTTDGTEPSKDRINTTSKQFTISLKPDIARTNPPTEQYPPIVLTETTTIKAVAYRGHERGEVSTITYTINAPTVLTSVVNKTPTDLVAGYAATLPLMITGENIAERTVELRFIDALGVALGEVVTVVAPSDSFGYSLRVATIADAGAYTVEARIAGKNAVSCPVAVNAPPADLWTPVYGENAEGYLTIGFPAQISAAAGKFKVTLNGAAVNASIVGQQIATAVKAADTKAGDVFVVAGVKYPALFPSYSFTFTISIK